jgi:chromosome segregation ATPase
MATPITVQDRESESPDHHRNQNGTIHEQGQQIPDGDRLGEAGYKALRSERQARKAAESELRDVGARVAELEQRIERITAEHGRLLAEVRLRLAPVDVLSNEVATLHERVEELMRIEP